MRGGRHCNRWRALVLDRRASGRPGCWPAGQMHMDRGTFLPTTRSLRGAAIAFSTESARPPPPQRDRWERALRHGCRYPALATPIRHPTRTVPNTKTRATGPARHVRVSRVEGDACYGSGREVLDREGSIVRVRSLSEGQQINVSRYRVYFALGDARYLSGTPRNLSTLTPVGPPRSSVNALGTQRSARIPRSRRDTHILLLESRHPHTKGERHQTRSNRVSARGVRRLHQQTRRRPSVQARLGRCRIMRARKSDGIDVKVGWRLVTRA